MGVSFLVIVESHFKALMSCLNLTQGPCLCFFSVVGEGVLSHILCGGS